MSTSDQLGEFTGDLSERPAAETQRAGTLWTALDGTVYQVRRDPGTGAQSWLAVAGAGGGGVPSSLAVTTDDALTVNGGHATTLAGALAFAALAASATQRGTFGPLDFQKLAQFLAESNYFRLDAARALAGNLDLGGHRATNGAAAVAPNDLVILAQLTMAAAGFTALAGGPVRVASTAADGNVALAGAPTIRGVTVNPGDALHSVLLTAQTDPAENGPWDVAAGAWTRRADAPAGAALAHGAYVLALAGTPDAAGKGGAGAAWALSNDVGAVDTDPETWVEVLVSPTFTASRGVALVGADFQGVPALGGALKVTPAGFDVDTLRTDAQHGDLGGGALHALATTLAAGFMSPADKAAVVAVGAAGAEWSFGGVGPAGTSVGVPTPAPNTPYWLTPNGAAAAPWRRPAFDARFVRQLVVFVRANPFAQPSLVDVVRGGPTLATPAEVTPFGLVVPAGATGWFAGPAVPAYAVPPQSTLDVRVGTYGITASGLDLVAAFAVGPTP